MNVADLTRAQRDALNVLVTNFPKPVRGGKRRSRSHPVPQVNTRAADSLVDVGLAHIRPLPWPTPFTTGYEYTATQAGIAAVRSNGAGG